jgi:O-antigen ligase
LWYVTGYPHNLILEILLSGGLIYLGITVFFVAIFVKKILFFAIKNDVLFIYIILYPIIQLMFSGTYLVTTEFWIIVTYSIIHFFRSKKLGGKGFETKN